MSVMPAYFVSCSWRRRCATDRGRVRGGGCDRSLGAYAGGSSSGLRSVPDIRSLTAKKMLCGVPSIRHMALCSSMLWPVTPGVCAEVGVDVGAANVTNSLWWSSAQTSHLGNRWPLWEQAAVYHLIPGLRPVGATVTRVARTSTSKLSELSQSVVWGQW